MSELKKFEFNSLSELRAHLESVDSKERVFILFTGSKTEEDNQSWCPDCNVADPVIHSSLELLDKDSDQFITCYVGDRPSWKNPENEFRTDKEFQLKNIPTLMQWKKVCLLDNNIQI